MLNAAVKKYDPLRRFLFELRRSIANLDWTQTPAIGGPDTLAHEIAAPLVVVAAVGIRRTVIATIAVGVTVSRVGTREAQT